MILGFDPGRDKCGLAIADTTGAIAAQQVVTAAAALPTLVAWRSQYALQQIVIGNQTTAKLWEAQLRATFPDLPIALVDERNSSLEARDRYWQLYPPRGWRWLIPQGLRLPPRPVDDIVAILLIERYLAAVAGERTGA